MSAGLIKSNALFRTWLILMAWITCLVPRPKTIEIHHKSTQNVLKENSTNTEQGTMRVCAVAFLRQLCTYILHWEGIVTCSADSMPHTHTHTITDTSVCSDLVIQFVGYNSGSFLQFSITQWPNPQGHLQNNRNKGNALVSKSIWTLNYF